MLDNDQQYARAADLYKKYSEAVADKPQDSAQAYFFACNAYEKANDIAQQNACLKDFIKKYDKQQAAGEFVVQAYMKQAVDHRALEQEQDRGARRLQARARRVHPAASCRRRRRPRASPPRPTSCIMEEKFKAFQKKELKFGSKPDQIKKTFDSLHRRGEGAERGLPEDLGLQGRDLDAGVVPALGRRLLRVRAEADQGRRQRRPRS